MKTLNQNGSWIYQVGSPVVGPSNPKINPQQTPPNPAPAITDSTPAPAPLPGPTQVFGGLISNPVIPALEVSLTSVAGVNFQSTGSDTKVAAPISAAGSNTILVPNSSVSHRNPS
jgi:hypothetical protein